MTRDELLKLRKDLFEKHEALQRLGDFDANAANVRMLMATNLKLVDHLLEKSRKPTA